jgi:hypothetical protein
MIAIGRRRPSGGSGAAAGSCELRSHLTPQREIGELRWTNEIPRKASAYLPRRSTTTADMMLAFRMDHHETYGVEPDFLCF